MPSVPSTVRATVLRAAAACALVLGAAACGSATAPGERVLTMEIAAERVPCVGVGPQQCLQVRWNGGGEWELFYDSVEGFAYEPGYRYVLRVARRHVPDPPADGSSLAYRLLAVLSRTPAGG